MRPLAREVIAPAVLNYAAAVQEPTLGGTGEINVSALNYAATVGSPTITGVIAPPALNYAASVQSPTVESATTPIAELDGFTLVTQLRSSPGSFSISAGSNRVLIVNECARGGPNASPVTAITYGGQSLTQVITASTTAGGPDMDSAIWILDEAGIAAASGTAFSITPTTAGITFAMFAASYENVDQTDPTVDEFSATNTTSGNPTTQALTSLADGYAIAALNANRGTNSGGATEDASYSNMTEEQEIADGNAYFSVADAATTGATFTPGTTLTHEDAGHLLAVSLRPA